MSDEEMYVILGIQDEPRRAEFLAALSPEKRATYVRLYELSHELNLWTAGLGPKPTGVIICGEHQVRSGKP